jgi:hypothetical protein
MSKPKINNDKLLHLIDTKGLNQSQAARRLGVSRQAICKRLQKIRGRTTRIVAVKKTEQLADSKINAIHELQKINSDANEVLDLLMRWSRGDKVALQILESQIKYVKVNGKEEPVKDYKLKDPRELALRAISEIRQQLVLQTRIFQSLYSIQEVREFMNTVLEVMREVDPDIRREIIRRLNAKKSITSSVHFS